MKVKYKFITGTQVIFYEIDMFEDNISGIINTLKLVDNRENLSYHFMFNMSEAFELIDTTKISSDELKTRFIQQIDRKIKKATQIAFKLKESNQTGRAFHLTAVFKKNRLLTVGVNNYKKTHPEVEKIKYLNKENERYNACIHSELAAWLNLDKANCSDFVFVNVRIDKNNKVGMSRPCSGCIKLLKKIRFKKFYYTDCDGNFIEYK